MRKDLALFTFIVEITAYYVAKLFNVGKIGFSMVTDCTISIAAAFSKQTPVSLLILTKSVLHCEILNRHIT